MDTEFQDIRIVGLDDDASYKPDPNKALYNVVLELSGTPPPDWERYFNQRWKSEFYMMKRRAEVSGRLLTIHCVPDELEREHLPRLRDVVSETNMAYRAHHQESERRRSHERAEAERDRAELRQLKHTLRFE